MQISFPFLKLHLHAWKNTLSQYLIHNIKWNKYLKEKKPTSTCFELVLKLQVNFFICKQLISTHILVHRWKNDIKLFILHCRKTSKLIKTWIIFFTDLRLFFIFQSTKYLLFQVKVHSPNSWEYACSFLSFYN